MNTQQFKLNDVVTLASSSQGYRTTKIGRIIAVVAPNEPVWTAERRLALGDGPGLKDVGSPRKHETYVVLVGRKLYWPRVNALSIVLPEDRILAEEAP